MRYTYIILCADNTLYTGITRDLERRIAEHNHSHLGASYTRGRRPVTLVRSHSYSSRSDASREEYRIKQLSRADKLLLIDNEQDKRESGNEIFSISKGILT